DWRQLGEHAQRRTDASPRQNCWVYALSEVPQFAQGLLELAGGAIESLDQCFISVGRGLVPRHSKGEPKCHQPLLRAVMNVAFQSFALRVRCLEDAGSRSP